MKKKLVIMIMSALLVGLLGGCGENAENPAQTAEGTEQSQAAEETERVNLKDIPLADHVTLGEYKNLEVKVAPVSVDEAQVEQVMLSEYLSNVTKENGGIVDRAVEVGDTVIIDYEGKQDGVAFDGGTAKDASLAIGSGQFIAGFEEGLVGVMPGETVDLNLTFPEDYHSADMAGAEVVFTVTVHYILPTQVDESVVPSFGREEYQNAEELRQYVYDALYEMAESEHDAQVEGSVVQAVVNNAQYQSLPEELVAQYKAIVTESMEYMAYMNGVDADTFSNYIYGMGAEEFAQQNAENSTKQSMAFQMIADTEGISLSDEEFDTALEEYAKSVGGSAEQLRSQNSEEELKEFFLFQKVVDFLLENNTVVEE